MIACVAVKFLPYLARAHPLAHNFDFPESAVLLASCPLNLFLSRHSESFDNHHPTPPHSRLPLVRPTVIRLVLDDEFEYAESIVCLSRGSIFDIPPVTAILVGASLPNLPFSPLAPPSYLLKKTSC